MIPVLLASIFLNFLLVYYGVSTHFTKVSLYRLYQEYPAVSAPSTTHTDLASCSCYQSDLVLKSIIHCSLPSFYFYIFLFLCVLNLFLRLVRIVIRDNSNCTQLSFYGHKSFATSSRPRDSNFALLGLVVTRSQSRAPRLQ